MTNRGKTALAGLGAFTLVAGLLSTAQPALAASASACVNSPSATNCDGLDAGLSDSDPHGGASCLRGAFQVGDGDHGPSTFPFVPSYIYGPVSGPVGVQVQLWWSPKCQTNWTRIVSTGYRGPAWVKVMRLSNGHAEGEFVNDPEGLTDSVTAWVSPMVYAPSPVESCAGDNVRWGECRRQLT